MGGTSVFFKSYSSIRASKYQKLVQFLAVAMVAQLVVFGLGGIAPIPEAEAGIKPTSYQLYTASFYTRYSYWSYSGSDIGLPGSPIPPEVNVAIIGTGVDKSALPAGVLVTYTLDATRDLIDPTGISTGDASVISQLYPGTNLKITSFAVQGTDCQGDVSGKVLSALNTMRYPRKSWIPSPDMKAAYPPGC